MIRVSFGIYNTEEEVDRFLDRLQECLRLTKEQAEAIIAEGMDPFPPEF